MVIYLIDICIVLFPLFIIVHTHCFINMWNETLIVNLRTNFVLPGERQGVHVSFFSSLAIFFNFLFSSTEKYLGGSLRNH